MVPEVETAGKAVRAAVDVLEKEIAVVKMPPQTRGALQNAVLVLGTALLHCRFVYRELNGYTLLRDRAAAASKGGQSGNTEKPGVGTGQDQRGSPQAAGQLPGGPDQAGPGNPPQAGDRPAAPASQPVRRRGRSAHASRRTHPKKPGRKGTGKGR